MSNAQRKNPPRILIMAGGTGGHVFPALAVAEKLRQQGVAVDWLGTQRGLESRLVPAANIPLHTIPISGLRGKGALGWLLAPFRISYALLVALGVVMKLKPAAVLGMGGFVTGPGGIASWLLRRPLLVHEQNAVAGLTNTLLARFADTVMEAFPSSFKDNVSAIQTGNPVRAEIAAIAAPAQRLAGRSGPLHLLIIGGSLGAQALNQVVPAAVERLKTDPPPTIWHQTGKAMQEETRVDYDIKSIPARVEAFIEDMAEAYAWADLVICRAGALTIAELAAAGVASILVPYPYAVDDHQTANAGFLVEAGAALLLPQDKLNPDSLAELLQGIIGQRQRLPAMAGAARQQARIHATEDVANLCMQAMEAA
ncbi:undecaprenyldiphospho-muramoylpentapeptide beta-N-acetylglucosaminyltransferase [Sulfuriflexus mobilis]|uniref:undecaprenyldiphospho-muramoylpentapeptide beta-N-acetylglucosaminyltransferase n=1 Tax=Sulfuriflexus mobilis TaxID=1811807 RepID=UPI000F81DF2C|nr:undecaprenyldiphospho-muramoylpentapeptide beta-N-acetylglucosaminyltransferase [Sulfuriflexus mobilis]